MLKYVGERDYITTDFMICTFAKEYLGYHIKKKQIDWVCGTNGRQMS